MGSPPSPPPYMVTVRCPSCWVELYTQPLPSGSNRRERTARSQAGPDETCSGASFRARMDERERLYKEGSAANCPEVTQDERLRLHRQDLLGNTVDGTDPASLASILLAVEKVFAQERD